MTPDEVREIVREIVREELATAYKRLAEEAMLELSMHDAAGTGGMPVMKMLMDELVPAWRAENGDAL